MKMKNTIASIILICLLIFALTGCNIIASADSNGVAHDNPASYEYPANSRFKIISKETIDDGTLNGLEISILVDKETRVMYMYTVKYQSGYGTALEILVDKDGKPLLYEGDLN